MDGAAAEMLEKIAARSPQSPHPPVDVFMFPRHCPLPDEGVTFSEWLMPHCDLSNPDDEEVAEVLYDGDRATLTSLLRQGDRLDSFAALPDDAEWCFQLYNGRGHLPVLRNASHVFAILTTSAQCVTAMGGLALPTPDAARTPNAGHRKYMAKDVWFEECGDGGLYVLGVDDAVLLFYVDGPGDMVMGRWRCSYDRWEALWLGAFGSTMVLP